MAHILLESEAAKYLSLFMVIRLSMRPVLHFSASGTFLTGSASFTLSEEKNCGLVSPVSSSKYFRLEQVEDLGSEDTNLASTLTSLLGEESSFL